MATMPADQRAHESTWRERRPLVHWRVANPLADAADVLDVSPAAVESFIARDVLPALLIDGWLLVSYPDLVDPDRDPLIAKLQHAWSQTLEWEGDMAADRFPNRPTSQPPDCDCDGCLTRYRPSQPQP